MIGKSVIDLASDPSQDASLDLGRCERVLKFCEQRVRSVAFPAISGQ